MGMGCLEALTPDLPVPRRFTDILLDWNSDERASLPVYEYRREQLTKTVGSLSEASGNTYVLERIQRSYNDTAVFLELTVRTESTAEAKTLPVPLYNAGPVDVQLFFRKHPKSAQVLVNGELCPSLQGRGSGHAAVSRSLREGCDGK